LRSFCPPEWLADYERRARELAGAVTGRLYLRLTHARYGVARTLTYRAPEARDVLVFDPTSH